MTKKVKRSSKKINDQQNLKLKACLEHVQQNLRLMYQERLPTEVKIGVELLYNDIDKTLKEVG